MEKQQAEVAPKGSKKSAVSRQQVLDAAIRTLADQGLANTSVSDIAEAAKMSKGVVHYHFESKDELLRRVLENCSEVLAFRVREAWQTSGTPAERIRRALRVMLATRTDGSPEMRVLTDLMALAIHDEPLKALLAEQFERRRNELLEDLLKTASELGLRARIAPAVIPRLLVAALDGLGFHQLFDPPSQDEQQELPRALELLAFSLFEW